MRKRPPTPVQIIDGGDLPEGHDPTMGPGRLPPRRAHTPGTRSGIPGWMARPIGAGETGLPNAVPAGQVVELDGGGHGLSGLEGWTF